MHHAHAHMSLQNRYPSLIQMPSPRYPLPVTVTTASVSVAVHCPVASSSVQCVYQECWPPWCSRSKRDTDTEAGRSPVASGHGMPWAYAGYRGRGGSCCKKKAARKRRRRFSQAQDTMTMRGTYRRLEVAHAHGPRNAPSCNNDTIRCRWRARAREERRE